MGTFRFTLVTFVATFAVGLDARAQTPATHDTSDAPAAATSSAPTVNAGPDGLTVRSSDGNFQFRLRGYFQSDVRAAADDAADTVVDTFVLRRVRPILETTVYERFSFRLMPDFAEGRVTLFDAHMDFRLSSALSLRAGKFKSPFGLERLQSATDLLFVERAFPTLVAPNRDVGIMASGALAGAGHWAGALVNGTPDGGSSDLDDNDGKDLVGRLVLFPLSAFEHRRTGTLTVALAADRQNRAGTALLPGLSQPRTPGQQAIFRFLGVTSEPARVVVDGLHWRMSPQATYYVGPFGLLFEFVRSSQHVRYGAEEHDVITRAWQVAGSWVLSGERAGARGVEPASPFDPKSGTWGALQLAARVHEIGLDRVTYLAMAEAGRSRRARAWTVGLNWSLNRGIKLVANYEEVHVHGVTSRPPERLFLGRAQLSF